MTKNMVALQKEMTQPNAMGFAYKYIAPYTKTHSTDTVFIEGYNGISSFDSHSPVLSYKNPIISHKAILGLISCIVK